MLPALSAGKVGKESDLIEIEDQNFIRRDDLSLDAFNARIGAWGRIDGISSGPDFKTEPPGDAGIHNPEYQYGDCRHLWE